MNSKSTSALFFLALPLSVLIVLSACFGIFNSETYITESENWKTQGIAQDLFNLIIVAPLLIIAGTLSFFKKKTAVFIFGGTLLFLIYSFIIYCFAVHYNQLFLVYCAILGLSVYIFAYLVSSLLPKVVSGWFDGLVPVKLIGRFLIFVALLFYFLWLREIVPASLHNKIPQSVTTANLLTNPVHVLDLSIFLPGFLIIGSFLLKQNKIALMLTPVILVFFVLMDLNIIAILIKSKGTEQSLSMLLMASLLAAISLVLLLIFFSHFKKKENTHLIFSHFYGDESYS